MDPKDLQIENLMVENSELKIDLEVMATCLRNVKSEAEEKIARLEAVLNEQNAMLDYLLWRSKASALCNDPKDPNGKN
jgi:hypothetical protein